MVSVHAFRYHPKLLYPHVPYYAGEGDFAERH